MCVFAHFLTKGMLMFLLYEPLSSGTCAYMAMDGFLASDLEEEKSSSKDLERKFCHKQILQLKSNSHFEGIEKINGQTKRKLR